MLDEIQKLMFDRSHFVRFLISNEFDIKKTLAHFQEYLEWRKAQNIDRLAVNTDPLHLILTGIGVRAL